ncbi:uncharacterized protein LOC132284882 [Cornus florida]|uniref:uncharacterized protein LOC132284882 n=1 Tax=Cornus florida TaxID=4283 RepID=UPI0028A03C0A|nr:uncharacterized protein LOC132284882 [Cornus florida]
MEKFLSPHDKECMKMAMLKHEETFKHQVCELHRLYKIQKIMMKGIASRRQREEKQERWKYSKNGISFDDDDDCHGAQTVLDLEQLPDDDVNGMVEIEDESEIVLTLGPTSYNRRVKKGETPLTSESGPSFSSSSTGSNYMMMKTSGTQRQRSTEDELSGHKWGRVLMEVPKSGFQSRIDVQEQLREDRMKQSPWLFQTLSFNMT